MELRTLRSFVALAETMSFSAASDDLHITQSALSQQLQVLESELGVELIDRTNRRRIKLTGAGEVLLERGKRLLAQETSLVEEVRSAVAGTATLAIGQMGSATSPFIAQWVREFRETYPVAEIRFFDLSPSEQERRMERHQIDIGFVREPNPKRHLQLNSHLVYEDRLMLAVPADHPDFASTTILDYRETPLILYNRAQAPWLNQAVEGYLFQNNMAPRQVHIVEGMAPLLLTIASGQGYSLVPSCLRNLAIPGLTFIELVPKSPPLSVSMVWMKDNRSHVLRAFLDFIRPRIGLLQNSEWLA